MIIDRINALLKHYKRPTVSVYASKRTADQGLHRLLNQIDWASGLITRGSDTVGARVRRHEENLSTPAYMHGGILVDPEIPSKLKKLL